MTKIKVLKYTQKELIAAYKQSECPDLDFGPVKSSEPSHPIQLHFLSDQNRNSKEYNGYKQSNRTPVITNFSSSEYKAVVNTPLKRFNPSPNFNPQPISASDSKEEAKKEPEIISFESVLSSIKKEKIDQYQEIRESISPLPQNFQNSPQNYQQQTQKQQFGQTFNGIYSTFPQNPMQNPHLFQQFLAYNSMMNHNQQMHLYNMMQQSMNKQQNMYQNITQQQNQFFSNQPLNSSENPPKPPQNMYYPQQNSQMSPQQAEYFRQQMQLFNQMQQLQQMRFIQQQMFFQEQMKQQMASQGFTYSQNHMNSFSSQNQTNPNDNLNSEDYEYDNEYYANDYSDYNEEEESCENRDDVEINDKNNRFISKENIENEIDTNKLEKKLVMEDDANTDQEKSNVDVINEERPLIPGFCPKHFSADTQCYNPYEIDGILPSRDAYYETSYKEKKNLNSRFAPYIPSESKANSYQ